MPPTVSPFSPALPSGAAAPTRADAAEPAFAAAAVPSDQGIKVVRAITIRATPDALYAFWRNVANLPRIANHPLTVVPRSALESHWVVSAPAHRRVEWNAIIINDEPGRLIAWRTTADADVGNAGSIRFAPAPGD